MCTETCRERHKRARDTPCMWRGRHTPKIERDEQEQRDRFREIHVETGRNKDGDRGMHTYRSTNTCADPRMWRHVGT